MKLGGNHKANVAAESNWSWIKAWIQLSFDFKNWQQPITQINCGINQLAKSILNLLLINWIHWLKTFNPGMKLNQANGIEFIANYWFSRNSSHVQFNSQFSFNSVSDFIPAIHCAKTFLLEMKSGIELRMELMNYF